MPSKKRVLITGGAGFIGSHTVDSFLKNGFNDFEENFKDTFFSYYCGILTLTSLEIKRNGYYKIYILSIIGLIVVIFNTLALNSLFWIDIIIGCIFAHYIY